MPKEFGILLVCSFVLSSTFVYAQANSAEQNKEQMIKAINYVMPFAGKRILKENMKYLSDALIIQKVPQDIIQDIMSKVEINQSDEIAVKVFSQYFTVEDVQSINAFYESSVGKKFTQTMPLFAGEYFKQSSELSFKIYQDIFEQLKAKGYPLDDLRKAYLSPVELPAEMLSNAASSESMQKE
jgi:hypothetical protein